MPSRVSFSRSTHDQMSDFQNPGLSSNLVDVGIFRKGYLAGSCDLGEWQGPASRRFMYSPTEMPGSIWALNDSFPKSHNPMKILDSTCKIPSKVDFLNKYVTTISEFYFRRSFFNLNFHNDIFIIIKWQEIDAGSLNFIILNVTGMARILKRQKKCFS